MKKAGYRLLLALVVPSLAAPLHAQSWKLDGGERAMMGFGTAVAVGDGEVITGWPHFSGFTPMLPLDIPGDVLVFRRDASGVWNEATRFRASDGTRDNRFARALALHGSRLLLGATKQDDDVGAAYIFERSASGEWSEAARLRPSDETDLQNLGRAVALSEDFALVSSVAYNEGAGIVYVFRRDASTGSWSEHSQLVGSDIDSLNYFGLAVAIEGDLALVGAPFQNRRAGAAYIFRYDEQSGAWREEAKLEGSGVESNGQFGTATALRGGHAIVGAPGYGGFVGAVFVFGRDAESGGWSEQDRLVPFDGTRGHAFGDVIALSESEVWVGAPGANGSEGRVYLFQRDAETHAWTSVTKLKVDGLQLLDRFAYSLAVQGDLAAVTIGNDDYGEGTVAIFERDPATGEWKTDTKVWSETAAMDAIVGAQVSCEEGAAALFDCGQVDLVSFLPVQDIGGSRGVEVSDVWGWEDPQTGREYALVGRYDGTSFIDISNPANPVYVGNLPLHEGAIGNVWRDIKVYKDHVFIVSDGAGPHGVQVFDLTQLRDVQSAPTTFEETAHYDGINSAHNIAINEETGYAYSVGSSGRETCGGGLHMINIQDPKRPTFAGCFADTTTGRRKTGYSHDVQCVVYRGPDTEHQGKEICFGSNETALSIADVTDKENPVALSMATYPNVAYAHQGWLTEDHRYFFMDDEGDELSGSVPATRTLVWDVIDLDDPVLLKEFFGTTRATDHNLYIRGDRVYQSNYVAGLRILDISDVENPREIAYFDTVPYGENRPGFAGTWSNYPFFRSGVIVVTSGREGVFILKMKETLIP